MDPIEIILKHMSLYNRDEATFVTMKLACVCTKFRNKYKKFVKYESLNPKIHKDVEKIRTNSVIQWNTRGLYDRMNEHAIIRQAISLFPNENRMTEWQLVNYCVSQNVRPYDFAFAYINLRLSTTAIFKGTHDEFVCVSFEIANKNHDLKPNIKMSQNDFRFYIWCEKIVFGKLPDPQNIINVFDEDDMTRDAVNMANRAVRIGLASERIESWNTECNQVLIFYKYEINKKFTIRRKQSKKDAVLISKLNKCIDLLRIFKQK
jgi:hypothetical protein